MEKMITITYSKEWDEYRVPNIPNPFLRMKDDLYYTDDRKDAIATAKKIHGDDVIVKIRRVA